MAILQPTSPFAYAVEKGLPIPRKGDWGWDAWERLTDGMKYKERRELEKIIEGEHPKRGGMDTVLSDYAKWLGISWDEGARDFEHGRGIEDFLDDILKERERFEKWRSGDRMTRTEAEAERAGAEASQHENGMTDAEFAEEDAWVRASEARRVEAERMGEQDDLSDMPAFSRAPRGDAIESNIRQMLKHDKVYDPSDSLHFAYSASQNEIAFFHDNGDLTFDIIARDKLTPNGIKRVTEFSKFYRTDENGENLDKSIQEFKSSVRSGNMGGGSKAQNGTSADANGDLALGRQDNGPKPDRRKGAGTGEAGSVSGIQFSRGGLYTGSAADYEKPSLLKVGTGEGSQVYVVIRPVLWPFCSVGRLGVEEVHRGKVNLRRIAPDLDVHDRVDVDVDEVRVRHGLGRLHVQLS